MRDALTLATTANSAYSAGHSVGGKLLLRDFMNSGAITSVYIRDKDAQSVAYELWLFRKDPVAATITDKTTFAVSTDLANLAAPVIPIAGLYSGGTGGGVLGVASIYVPFYIQETKDVYMALITRGTPTYTSGNAVQLVITAEKLFYS